MARDWADSAQISIGHRMDDGSAWYAPTAIWNVELSKSGTSNLRVEGFSLSLLALRLFALILVIIGLLQAIANILETVRDFNPSHAGYCINSQRLRPATLFTGGLLTWALSPAPGGWISAGFGP